MPPNPSQKPLSAPYVPAIVFAPISKMYARILTLDDNSRIACTTIYVYGTQTDTLSARYRTKRETDDGPHARPGTCRMEQSQIPKDALCIPKSDIQGQSEVLR